MTEAMGTTETTPKTRISETTRRTSEHDWGERRLCGGSDRYGVPASTARAYLPHAVEPRRLGAGLRHSLGLSETRDPTSGSWPDLAASSPGCCTCGRRGRS